AHHGQAAARRSPPDAKRLERRGRARLPYLGTEIRLPVEREMAMAVDHPRHYELAGRRDDLGALAVRCLRDRAPLTDPRDFRTLHDDRRVGHRSCAIEETFDLE